MKKTQEKRYIPYKRNCFLYTNNNWKTFDVVRGETPESNYLLENNQDIVAAVKLRHEYGDMAASFLINEFKRIEDEYFRITETKLPEQTGFGGAFEILAISVLHSLPTEMVIKKFLVDGSKDGKIDAIYYAQDECVVYQIKTGMVEDNVLDIMRDRIHLYKQGRLNTVPKCSDLIRFLDKMDPPITKARNIWYRTISTNGKKASNIDSSQIYEGFLRSSLIQGSSNSELVIRKEMEEKTFVASKDKRIFFMFIDAKSFLEDIDEFTKRNGFGALYRNNVRGSLGENSEMIRSMQNEPALFCAYNNGISITGSFSCPDEEAFEIVIKDANIINGQQTIHNLFLARDKGVRLDEVTLPLFIKNRASIVEQSRIARFNNSQRRVSAVDLLSIDENLRSIQASLIGEGFKDGFFLNLLSSGKNECLENAKRVFGKQRIIKLSDFVKLFSVISDPDDLGKWKNNYNQQIETVYHDGFPECDTAKAVKICKSVARSKAIIRSNRSKYAIADLAIQYLLYRDCSEERTMAIVDEITVRGSQDGTKPADIYKKKSIGPLVLTALCGR